MYTDSSKLIGEILIDPLTIGDFSQTAPDIEDKILNDLLGFELYTALLATPADAKYVALLNGGTYTGDDGYLHEVKGIKEMLPYFFFFYYLRDNESYNTSAGEFSSSAQNAGRSVANLNNKLVNAYNVGVKLYNQLYEFISYKQSAEGDSYYNHWLFVPKHELNRFGV